jgi:preprotein translocase SecE subunit
MSADKPKKRRIKKTETIREKASTAAVTTKPRRRMVRRTAGTVSRPLRWLGRRVSRLLRPFRFLLWPFKTRPARFIGRILATILLLRFFRDAWRELRQVVWPSRKETWKLTVAVFVFAILFGIIIAITDFGLDKLFRKVLLT